MSEKRTSVSFDWAIKNILRDKANYDVLKMPEDERRAYEKYLANKASERDMIETAYIEGKAEGKIEGKIERSREIAAKLLRGE